MTFILTRDSFQNITFQNRIFLHKITKNVHFRKKMVGLGNKIEIKRF